MALLGRALGSTHVQCRWSLKPRFVSPFPRKHPLNHIAGKSKVWLGPVETNINLIGDCDRMIFNCSTPFGER